MLDTVSAGHIEVGAARRAVLGGTALGDLMAGHDILAWTNFVGARVVVAVDGRVFDSTAEIVDGEAVAWLSAWGGQSRQKH